MWNWTVDHSPTRPSRVYLGEPEDKGPWPDLNGWDPKTGTNRNSAHPGLLAGDTFVRCRRRRRPEIRFNPADGRPAFPLLRPHVGQRAPQSPNGHTGTPFLGADGRRAHGSTPGGVPDPYAGRPDGLCPQIAPVAPLQHDAGRAADPGHARGGGRHRSDRRDLRPQPRTRPTCWPARKPAAPLAIRVEHRRLRQRHARQRDDRRDALRRLHQGRTCTSTTCSSTSRARTARARATSFDQSMRPYTARRTPS